MIELIQHRFPDTVIQHMINKLDTTTVTFNIELLMKDIEKFEAAIKASSGKNKQNIKAISQYLRRLLKSLDENLELELAWNPDSDTGLPKSYPIKLVCDDTYNVNTCNYIEVDKDSKLVDIELHELANIIAFEFMYRDIGETHSSMEGLLKDCGVTTIEKSSILTDFFEALEPDQTMYELSKELRIGDSPYCIKENGKIQDYFDTKIFKADKYRQVVNYSCEYANSIILSNIYKEATKSKLNLRILAIEPTRLQFIIKDCPNEVIKEQLIGDIVIRSFGRRFKINNKINIY